MKKALAILVLVLAGCGVPDEQWDAFCPDGHCPVAKIGKAINADQRAKGEFWGSSDNRPMVSPNLPPMSPIPPMPKVNP